MPGISHLVFGLMLVVPFIVFARDKFNYKVAAIFVLNNWIGPDSYWPWRYIPFEGHALLGFIVWAIPLSLFYTYLTRFSFERTDRFFTIMDDEKREVSWGSAYLLCIAGATSHNFIDTLFHGPPYGMDLYPEQLREFFQDTFGITLNNPNLGDVNAWGTISYGLPETLIIVGFIGMIAASLFIIYYLKRELKVVVIFLFTLIILVILSQVLLGWETFGERELSATIYPLFFIFLPLVTFAWVMNDVQKHSTEESPPLLSTETAVKIVTGILLALAVVFFFIDLIYVTILFGSITVIFAIVIALSRWDTLNRWDLSVESASLIASMVLLVLAVVFLLLDIIFISMIFWLCVIPLGIAIALSRWDIGAETALKIAAGLTFILTGLFLFLGISPFFAPSITDALIGGYLSAETIEIVGIIIAVISAVGLVGAVGILFKLKIFRYITFFISLLLWFFVFPFAIALILGRNDVKELFENKSE